MNKKLISTSGLIGTIAGAYIPSLFGDNDIFSGWSILGGLIGGLLGVWLGVKLAQRF